MSEYSGAEIVEIDDLEGLLNGVKKFTNLKVRKTASHAAFKFARARFSKLNVQNTITYLIDGT